MAGKSSIVKKDAKTKKYIESELIKGTPVRTIASQSDTGYRSVQRYKEKVQTQISEKLAEDTDRTYETYQQTLEKVTVDLKELAEAIKLELKDRETGRYDLTNPARSMMYVRMLHDTLKVLLPYIEALDKISERAKAIAEINTRPELILAMITQTIRQATSIEDVLVRLKTINQ